MARKKLKTSRLDVRIAPKSKKKFDQSIRQINKYLKNDEQTDKSFWICYFIDVFSDFEEKVRDTPMVRELKKSNIKLPAEAFFLFLNQAYVKHVGKTGIKGMPDLAKTAMAKPKRKAQKKKAKKK